MFAWLADLLTFSRVFAAGILVWLGFQGASTLPTATLVAFVGWSTDQADGWAARRATAPTRLASYDFVIDATLYAGTLSYLVLAGFLPAVPVTAFVAVAVLAALLFRQKAIVIVFIRLVDLASMVVIFTHMPMVGFFLVLWLVVLAILYRRRLAHEVPRWLGDLAHTLRMGRPD